VIIEKITASSLLSLSLPSCMVVPIGELANKHLSATSFSSTNMISSQDSTLPTVLPLNNTGMDFFARPPSDNYDEMRDRSLFTKEYYSRDSSISFTKFSVVYHNKMECNSNIVDGSPALPYKTDQKKALCVSKTAELQENMKLKCDNPNPINFNPQHVFSNEQHSIPIHGSTMYNKDVNIINIQLPYDS